MTTGGVIFMVISWVCVIGLAVYCFARVLHKEKR